MTDAAIEQSTIDPGMEGVADDKDATIHTLQTEVNDLRSSLNRQTRNLADLREANERLQGHLYGLGEALRDEAIKREWCNEYDEFAEEWDLPKRAMDYEVTMTITVKATGDEEACQIVRDSMSIGEYDEGVVSGPCFYASEA